jgi:CDP-4-dehydro-6-deoxyglucose reductase
MPAAEPFTARLVDARALSPSVRHLVFERTDGAPMRFEPGQWINLFVGREEGELKRSYSIASPPDGAPHFELAVTRVLGGPVSEALHALEIGQELRAVGPHGLFTRAAGDPAPALFVGTGTGVAPLRSMIGAALAAGSSARLSLLLGVRRQDEMLYVEELSRWTTEHPSLSVCVTLSRPDAGWSGPTGHVQAHLARVFAELAAPDAHVFICGLDKMVHDVKARCRGELGLGRKQVHTEKYD